MKHLLDKPDYGRKVQVYRNLHKGCYSVRCKKSGRVIYHTDKIYLQDVEFKVSESGRQRVLREKRKNVHAFVEGVWLPMLPVTVSTTERIRYNPYKYGYFYSVNDFRGWAMVDSVSRRYKVILNEEGIFA
jgi:hypothetical protein